MAEWFAPTRRGLGAGLPIAWQGWALLFAYAAIVGGAFFVLGADDLAPFAVLAIATAVLLAIAARTTRGGWRWRWGKED